MSEVDEKEINKALADDIISEAVSNFMSKQDALTKEQFFDCLNEALASGDFVRHCTLMESRWHNSPETTIGGVSNFVIQQGQSMTYLPFRIAEELKQQNAKLVEKCNKFQQQIQDVDTDFWSIKKLNDELAQQNAEYRKLLREVSDILDDAEGYHSGDAMVISEAQEKIEKHLNRSEVKQILEEK